MAIRAQSTRHNEGWRRLQRLTGELVGQDDEVAILRVALADSPALFDCDRVEVWLGDAPRRPGVHARAERGSAGPVQVRPVGNEVPTGVPGDLVLPIVLGQEEVGLVRLVGGPRTGRSERERLAMGFASLLSVSLGAAHALRDERRRAQESVRRARQDGLTLLGNRRLLKEWGDHLLALASARSRTCALLLFDLDRFKQINDTLGHDVGDQVLTEIGRRVRGSIRDNDLAVRLGGDEFAVLTDDLGSPHDAERLAERLLAAIAEPLYVEDAELQIRSSVGIAVQGLDGGSTDALLRAADQAMYVAKAEGTGGWRRVPSPDQRPGASLARLVPQVRTGLLTGELEVHYQAQVSASGDRVWGFEALARWRHPELGLLAAREFLPVVERAGETRSLTAMVLDHALAGLPVLDAAAPGAALAVNFSPRDLLSHTLIQEVGAALGRYGVAPERLTIEVTEPSSGLLESPPLAAVAALGCQVSVSEYGAGPSSLTLLARHDAIRQIKLNASVVSQLPQEPARRLVGAVAIAAHTLGVTVVAEGVESALVASQVRELGCDVVQGAHYHAPARLAEVARWSAEVFPADA